MELILIDENKLKIMLSDTDMTDYSLDVDSLDYENTETRDIFWSILDRARAETGFDAQRGRVLIQLYPSRRGGCEMYVTRLNMDIERRKKDTSVSGGKRECGYRFDNLDDICAVCRRLAGLGYEDESDAFYHDGRYYLFIREPEENAYIPLSDHSFIREYGKNVGVKHARMSLCERGAHIFPEKAVEALSSF